MSNPDYWVQGNGMAIQGYTYDGVDPSDITVQVTITGAVSHPAGADSTGLTARISLFKLPTILEFPEIDDPSTLFLLGGLGADVTADIEVTANSNAIMEARNLTHENVANGAQFYLFIIMAASAGAANAQATSDNTLSVMILDGEGMTPALIAAGVTPAAPVAWQIPLPLWASMMLAGSLFVLATGQRRQGA